MPTDYRHKFVAERVHPATSNWRCRHIGDIRGAELAAPDLPVVPERRHQMTALRH
jgi:hypothetical protein